MATKRSRGSSTGRMNGITSRWSWRKITPDTCTDSSPCQSRLRSRRAPNDHATATTKKTNQGEARCFCRRYGRKMALPVYRTSPIPHCCINIEYIIHFDVLYISILFEVSSWGPQGGSLQSDLTSVVFSLKRVHARGFRGWEHRVVRKWLGCLQREVLASFLVLVKIWRLCVSCHFSSRFIAFFQLRLLWRKQKRGREIICVLGSTKACPEKSQRWCNGWQSAAAGLLYK